ncbi:TetR family transcriptional regulator [Actinoallomurus sp. NPDC050550]|uniref:TetR/AcrR family transcriptional regulator n=1 Tax=Actinoallomurus sp. NPDC050550 TaxID=3154937 RepID=UPI003404392F
MVAARDPEGRRRAIIEAAGQLIAEVGVGKLTHRLVAERAGVPLGSTTYYFSSLEDLIDETIAYVGEQFLQAMRSLSEGIACSDDVAASLAELIAGQMRCVKQPVLMVEMYLAATHRPELRPIARRWFEEMVDLLSARISRPAALAITVYVDGVMIQAMLHDEPPLGQEALADSLRALLTLR